MATCERCDETADNVSGLTVERAPVPLPAPRAAAVPRRRPAPERPIGLRCRVSRGAGPGGRARCGQL